MVGRAIQRFRRDLAYFVWRVTSEIYSGATARGYDRVARAAREGGRAAVLRVGATGELEIEREAERGEEDQVGRSNRSKI